MDKFIYWLEIKITRSRIELIIILTFHDVTCIVGPAAPTFYAQP